MNDIFLIYLAALIFIISIMQKVGTYRSTGFFVTFAVLAISISKNLTEVFVTIVAGLAVHVLMIFSIKEYIKVKK